MSVARCEEINRRLRAAGVEVVEHPGWRSRGNGQSPAYEGGIVHHTAGGYNTSVPGILVGGRSDLAGPLCNYAGLADGRLAVVAAYPANHAGASGGRSMGPLPRTSSFNRRVLGLEICYPGDRPMTAPQYRASCAWARVVAQVVGGGDIQRVRAHAETSITGKWDPGHAPGRTIDMAKFRRDAAAMSTVEDDDVSYLNWPMKDRNQLVNDITNHLKKELPEPIWNHNVRNFFMSQVKGKKVPEDAWVALGTLEMRIRAILAGERNATLTGVERLLTKQDRLTEDEARDIVAAEVDEVEKQIAALADEVRAERKGDQ